LAHSDLELEDDRYPSHITLINPEETQWVLNRYGREVLRRTMASRTWDGISETRIKPTGFRTLGQLGEKDGNSHLVCLVEWRNNGLTAACRESLGLGSGGSRLPEHITVCKKWHRGAEGLVTPIGLTLGITGVFLYSKEPGGSRQHEQLV
jgi:hypothetical protein